MELIDITQLIRVNMLHGCGCILSRRFTRNVSHRYAVKSVLAFSYADDYSIIRPRDSLPLILRLVSYKG